MITNVVFLFCTELKPVKAFVISVFIFFALLFPYKSTAQSLPLSVTASVHNMTSNFYNGLGVFYDGSVSSFVSGGQAPYTFSLKAALGTWYTNSNGYFIFIQPGTYWVHVTDALGQEANSTLFTVTTVYPSGTVPDAVFTRIIKPTDCNSADGSITIEGRNGTPPYTYSIDGGISFTTNNTFSGLIKGTYDFIVKDANGLLANNFTLPLGVLYPGPDKDSLYFSCRCCPFLTGAGASSVFSCSYGIGKNGNFIVAVLNPLLPDTSISYTYSIDGINYFESDRPEVTYKTFSLLPPGLYTGYIKDKNGFISKSNASIVSFCRVYIEYTSVSATCGQSDGTVTIHAINGEPPYTYTWDGINYQQDSTFTGLATGNYNFSVKDVSGNIHSAGAFVFDKCPSVSAIATNEICSRSDGTITAFGINGTRPYSFSLDAVNYQPNSIFKNLKAGAYTVYLKDALGFSKTTTVDIYTNCMLVSATADSSACGKNKGSITISAVNGLPPYQYSADRINYAADNVFTHLAAGTYTVYAKDGNDYIDSTTVIVGDRAGPVITGAVTTASDCSGNNGTVSVTASGFATPFLYRIDNSNGQDAGSFNAVTNGLHDLIVTDINGCTATVPVNVPLNNNLNFSIDKNKAVCKGSSVILATQSNAASYTWSPAQYLNNSSVANPEATTPVSQMFYVAAALGICNTTDSVFVTVKPFPEVHLGSDTILCEGQTLQLNVINPNLTYLWQDGSTFPNHTVTQQGLYHVKVNMDGCESGDTIKVEYKLKPVFSLGEDKFICSSQQLILQTNISNADYLWQDGSSSQSYTVTQPGLYELTVTNECGATKDSVIISQGVCELYIPSAFSPNNDGRNDVFRAGFGENITAYNLKIFNRFGQLLFESNDKGKGWDGRYKGKQQPVGVYTWFVQYQTSANSISKQMKGTLMLIQ